MKFILRIIFITLTAFSACAQQQYDAENNYNFKIIDDGKSVEIIGYKGSSTETKTEIRIPPRIQNLPVTAISEKAFLRAFYEVEVDQLAVIIPNSVTHIGTMAFAGNYLTDVVIPNSVTHIGEWSFANNAFTNITIPDSITHIGEYAFRENELTSVTIPDSVKYIGVGAFMENQLTNITIPNSVIHIGEWSFTRNQLTNITIPDNVTNIGAGAFYENQLTNITIPNSVTYIGSKAFFRNQLADITIGTNVELNKGIYFMSESGVYGMVEEGVFDNEFDDFYKNNKSRAGTYTYRNDRWSFSFPDNNQPVTSNSGNRLANTTWEAFEDSRITISFGETSFSLTYLVWVGLATSRDGLGERRMAGSYTMNGDSIALKGSSTNSTSREMTGALIGDVLTISGIGDGFEFYRIR
ncbi:MAG: leucine-rich repeat domain-containing protein [Treponema sp.]|nr:leucine-rich repeat domain-containing protein [Treponema sp.]